MVDYSEAVISGAVLTGVDYSLNLNKGSTAITNGAILAGTDALVQMLASGDRNGVLRYFVYKQHEPLSVAVIYALLQEAMRMFGKSGIYSAEWKAVLGNIFLASGSVALGIELNKALGMSPGAVSILTAASAASAGVANMGANVSVNSDAKSPKVRTVIM